MHDIACIHHSKGNRRTVSSHQRLHTQAKVPCNFIAVAGARIGGSTGEMSDPRL